MTNYEGLINNVDSRAIERIRKIVGKHIHQNTARKHPLYAELFVDYKVLLLRKRFPSYQKDHKFSSDTVELQAKFKRAIEIQTQQWLGRIHRLSDIK